MTNFPHWWNGICMLPQFDGSANDGPQTRWGWTFPTWCDAMGLPESAAALAEFSVLTEAAAETLAESYFWPLFGGTRLNGGPDVAFIDWRWTSGGATAFVQRALGCNPDGRVGPITIKAMNAVPAGELCQSIHDWRVAYYDSLGFRAEYPGLYTRANVALTLSLGLVA